MTEENIQTIPEEVLAQSEKILRSPYGLLGLGLISFIESALPVPLVTDPFLVVYVIANRTRLVAAIAVTTVTSALGGLTAYVLAFWFGSFFLTLLGPVSLAQFYSMAHRVDGETFLLTVLGSLTPVPYTIVALAVGFVKGNVVAFVLASLLARGIRYCIVGYLAYRVGPQVVKELKRHTLLFTIATTVLVGIYIAWKYL